MKQCVWVEFNCVNTWAVVCKTSALLSAMCYSLLQQQKQFDSVEAIENDKPFTKEDFLLHRLSRYRPPLGCTRSQGMC